MLKLTSSLNELPGVGKMTASILKKLGLENIHDLLFYFPFRYDDFSQQLKISQLKIGAKASVQGQIELIQNKKSPRRKLNITEALVTDGEEVLKVIWFNQPFLTRNYKVGDKISLAGPVSDNYGTLSMVSPIVEKVYAQKAIHTQGLIPNYHLSGKLTQKQLRSLIKRVISLSNQEIDYLPEDIRKRLNLISLNKALQQIHFPKDRREIEIARKRLGFSELFLRQLQAQIIKEKLKNRQAIKIKFQEEETKKFVASLPFQLTTSQRRSAWEILQDLEKDHPMNRLLEGDVGSGKTLTVILALLNVALNNKQAVLMVPTEILAQQHFNYISQLLKAYKFKISLLTHNYKNPEAQEADIIIGTHALIQKNISFPKLALAVVDEQHRFGVKQRQNIIDFNDKNGKTPHFLSLTATPIPRSLALTIYGNLDLSIINELPAKRKKIITKIVPEDERTTTYNFIHQEINNGRQAFVICPLIDISDKLNFKSAKDEYKKLSKDVFPDLNIALLHGKLKAKEKKKVMTDFLNNKIQILVSTSVIEVGVDVPNASLMIIENAERFGLASLHQFRGRIGRSHYQSYCFLFPSHEENNSSLTTERLKALSKYHDGFSLAKIDLKLRGAGEIYGENQSGFPELQIASLFDYENIKKAQVEAIKIIDKDPQLTKYPQLQKKLSIWIREIHLE